jgi:hypothetical protein
MVLDRIAATVSSNREAKKIFKEQKEKTGESVVIDPVNIPSSSPATYKTQTEY